MYDVHIMHVYNINAKVLCWLIVERKKERKKFL